jgi:Predicted pPIWI-associating nuclease
MPMAIGTQAMANNLPKFQPLYLKLQEDLERLKHTLKPSYLSIQEELARAIEPIRQAHLELARSTDSHGAAFSQLAEIAQANQRWQDLIARTADSVHGFTHIHQTWSDAIEPMHSAAAQLEAATKLTLGNLAYRLTVTERLLAGIDLETPRLAAVPPGLAVSKLQQVVGDFTLKYERLAESIHSLPDLTRLPAFTLPGATREVFVTGYALETIFVPDKPQSERDESEIELIAEVEEEVSGCIALLQAVDPSLALPYVGARNALRGSNPDRARHVLSSLRELWGHLLRRLAPDDQVLTWATGEDTELFYEGRPTRKARILYVCRRLNHHALTDFVMQDTRALMKLVELFNRVHELKPGLTDEQLRALLARTDSWLMYILQIWEGQSDDATLNSSS